MNTPAYIRNRFGQIIRTADEAVIAEVGDNTDYQEFQKWLKEGNTLDESSTPPPIPNQVEEYDWTTLAIALATSKFNEFLNQLKDNSTNPQISAIWRLSDDVSRIMGLDKFPDAIRLGAFERDLVKLFETLKLAEIGVSPTLLDEVVGILRKTKGFEKLADRMAEVELYAE